MGWHRHLWHPTPQVATAPEPLRVVSARGSLLQLDDGRQLIDAISSWWVTLHGHGEPSIAAAIAAQAQQLEQVIFANFSHPPAEQLAEKLASLTGLDRLFFSDNGSTAVEVALKSAWQWWRNRGEPRQQLIAFEGAYHGDTVGAMALGERSLFNSAYEGLMFSVARAPWPASWWGDESVEARELQALAVLDGLLEKPTAAVIFEPLLQGASGMNLVRPQFLRAVERRVRASGALLIADEVMTGFGRSGSLFACQRAQIQPDLMALSKGLTGGFMPMGVTMASERFYEAFIGIDPKLTFFHGHSFTANPLGCAAALASLELLKQQPQCYGQFEQRHRQHLEPLSEHPRLEKLRTIGSIAAFDLIVDQPGYLQSLGRQLQRQCLAKGVYLRPLGHVVYLLPPLGISEAHLEQFYSAILQSLAEL